MCGGLDGPSAGDSSYYRPVRNGGKGTRDKDNGGMKRKCSCGQINPTNTNCWKCGKPNHYSKRKEW